MMGARAVVGPEFPQPHIKRKIRGKSSMGIVIFESVKAHMYPEGKKAHANSTV
jgi:hypothetical protein